MFETQTKPKDPAEITVGCNVALVVGREPGFMTYNGKIALFQVYMKKNKSCIKVRGTYMQAELSEEELVRVDDPNETEFVLMYNPEKC